MDLQFEEWEKSSLEGRLDRLGLAFIDFSEFNEFSFNYGMNWGEEPVDNDIEAQVEAKMNLSYKDYILGETDYFMGCETMLTSERAALAKARQLHQKLAASGQTRFVDPDFGPLAFDDVQRGAKSIYKYGQPQQRGYPAPEDIDWVHAEDLSKDGHAHFVLKGASASDCVQGVLGDCWLVSAMSVIATRDELLMGGLTNMSVEKDMVVDKKMASAMSKGIYPPIFHRFRSRGIYVLRIFKELQWIYVLVDSRIPVDKRTRKPVFSHCGSQDPAEENAFNEIWV
jgi:hypothetical protein